MFIVIVQWGVQYQYLVKEKGCIVVIRYEWVGYIGRKWCGTGIVLPQKSKKERTVVGEKNSLINETPVVSRCQWRVGVMMVETISYANEYP